MDESERMGARRFQADMTMVMEDGVKEKKPKHWEWNGECKKTQREGRERKQKWMRNFKQKGEEKRAMEQEQEC